MSGILLLLGTNLGDRKTNLEQAIKYLSKKGITTIKRSYVYESEPWGIYDQPWFWNVLIEVSTILEPSGLLSQCLEVESELGRVRKRKWGERLIDIDILYFKDDIVHEDSLEIPHPGIPERNFTLIPLIEKWAHVIHPILKKNQSEILANLTSSLKCRKTEVLLDL